MKVPTVSLACFVMVSYCGLSDPLDRLSERTPALAETLTRLKRLDQRLGDCVRRSGTKTLRRHVSEAAGLPVWWREFDLY
jgi:hypothetical protein